MRMISMKINVAIFLIVLMTMQFNKTCCHLARSSNDEAAKLQSITKTLCDLRTNELISYYGYLAEEHHVVTEGGYNLTMYRCNSKKLHFENKKVVIYFHGFIGSSDDITLNMPGQGLAYVLADAGYDVWMPNNRGNFYSRSHLFMDPDDTDSKFWDFSWDDIAFQDYPAIFAYIRKSTRQPNFYIVTHSQGGSSIMALLSEYPEYNAQIHAINMMAPLGYIGHSKLLNISTNLVAQLTHNSPNYEILPRSKTYCVGIIGIIFCRGVLYLLSEKNETMVPTYICHYPSGSSTGQVIHYNQLIKYGYFGRRILKSTNEIPPDFPLHRITTPISIHYSISDAFVGPKDVEKTIAKLTGTTNHYIQKIDGDFNHFDYILGTQANDIVYSKILRFFQEN